MAYKLTVVLEGRTFPISLKNCGGCEWCTLGACGWFCEFEPDIPEACEYPEDVLAKNPAAEDQLEDGQLPLL